MQKQQENKVITIYDIAKEAGVSPSTVSRVLTNNVNVRAEKKEKIQKIIDKYNFKPNALAKGLSDTKSKVIGVLAADVRNPFYAEIFVACEEAAIEAGYTVLLSNSLGETQKEIEQLEMLNQQKVDAIIQFGGKVDDIVSNQEYVDKVNSLIARIPMIITGRLEGADCYKVQIDSFMAAELLMEHLISLGHRKIALVGGRRDVISTYDKYQKYLELLRKYEIPYREEYVVDGGYNFETGYEGMSKLLESKEPPTAVIAINDYAAAGVISSIKEHGLKVPEDISVVSYDNTQITEIVTPKVTGVDYNYAVFGKQLVDTAIAAIEKREISKDQWIDPILVVKESTAEVKKN